MLLETAVGDAYGACFETLEESIVKECNVDPPTVYWSSPYMPSLIRPGYYTDDTQMCLAIAEHMLEDAVWTPESVADRFVHCFRRDERRGYTTGFFTLLLNSNNGKELLGKIHGNSKYSGEAMRSAPLGLIEDLDELQIKCEIQSKVTHDSEEGIKSALAVAMATHYFRYNLGEKKDLVKWLNETEFEGYWGHPDHWQSGRVSVKAIDCTEAALQTVVTSNSLSEILWKSVSHGGDTDTVAAIAMGIGSQATEIEKGINQRLILDLENKKYGRTYLIEKDKELGVKYGNS